MNTPMSYVAINKSIEGSGFYIQQGYNGNLLKEGEGLLYTPMSDLMFSKSIP